MISEDNPSPTSDPSLLAEAQAEPKKRRKSKGGSTTVDPVPVERITSETDLRAPRQCKACGCTHELWQFAKENATTVGKRCKKARMHMNARLKCSNWTKRYQCGDDLYTLLMNAEERNVTAWAAQLKNQVDVTVSQDDINQCQY